MSIKTSSGTLSEWNNTLRTEQEGRKEAEQKLKDGTFIQKTTMDKNVVLDPPSEPYVETSDHFREDNLPELDLISRQFFLSCQKLKGGKASSIEKLNEFLENGANINAQYFTSNDVSVWDVLMTPSNQSTQFSWPSPEHRAVYGDTILHIAIKTKDKALLKWLSTRDDVDLNAMNGEGMTASMVADALGLQNMYNFYFVV